MNNDQILIVDDSTQMRDFLAKVVLGPEGFSIELARNGAEGLEIALEVNPALIITDYAMPDLTGLEMVEELRKAGRNIPTILITAEGSEDIAVQALRAGVMDYFVKPFDPLALLNAINRILKAAKVGSIQLGVPDQRRMQALNTLIAVGKSVTALHDLETILGQVLEGAIYLCGAEEGSIMLVDHETDELYVHVSKNLQEGLINHRLLVQDSLAGRVVSSRQPLLVNTDKMERIHTGHLVKSLLYVPLQIGDQVIGILDIHNRMSDSPISRQDVGIIAALADYAAIAITNARLIYDINSAYTRLDATLSGLTTPFFILDSNRQLLLCNKASYICFDNLGDEDDPTGRNLSDISSNKSLISLIDCVERGETFIGEVPIADRTYIMHVSPSEHIGMAVMMQDVTHYKERDREKSELILTVSHQVRSPLTAILSYIEFLNKTGNLNVNQLEFSYQVRRNVQLITDTINGLLDLGRIEAGVTQLREPVSVAGVARYAVEALKGEVASRGLSLDMKVEEHISEMLGDSAQLRQVFVNLVENAIKYTPSGGKISVAVEEREHQIIAQVSDTGIGIDPKDQPRIFDKFYRAKGVAAKGYQGTGLGLSIVKTIVEEHGGRIWVESVLGSGTTFTIIFPVAEAS
nr:response regulator [Anaerolineae bacterium]